MGQGPSVFAAGERTTFVLLLAALLIVVVWHVLATPRDSARADVRGIRIGSLIGLLATVLMVGNCSATGLESVHGAGYQLVLGQPLTYLATVLLLIGPLLVSLAAPALLTLGRLSPRRVSLIAIATGLSGAISLLTGWAGFVTSYAVFCVDPPTATSEATCAASTGALAAVWGVLGLVAMLPFVIRLGSRGAPTAAP
jgi:cytochrome bd-type quinol oxidase subunit 1